MPPVGPYATFDVCVTAQMKKGKSKSSAQAICGAIEKRTKEGKNTSALDEAKIAYDVAKKNAGIDEAAVWKSARKNDLPDAAFAYVESGGEKEKINGKTFTKPRSKRHLPHHTGAVRTGSENDTVDKSHLRNALARVSQTSIPSSAQASAKSHLVRHAKALKMGDYDESKKGCEEDMRKEKK